jgi:hypothetical protein
MRTIARLITETIARRDDASARQRAAADVAEMVARFPVPGLSLDPS